MNREFIPYEQALALKELGFDYPCVAIYIEDRFMFSGGNVTYKSGHKYYPKYAAPLYQQAFRWFREKYGLEYSVSRTPPEVVGKGRIKKYSAFVWGESLNPRGWAEYYNAYEEAELACLRKLIEIVKKKQR
jgi:hypothetical protein